MWLKIKYIILTIFIFSVFSVYSQDNTDDAVKKTKALLITDPDYEPKDNLKKLPVVFNIGGSFSTTDRVLFKSFQGASGGGFEPFPNDKWYMDLAGKVWTRLAFEKDRYLHLGFLAMAKINR
jgi:hypothetical protein